MVTLTEQVGIDSKRFGRDIPDRLQLKNMEIVFYQFDDWKSIVVVRSGPCGRPTRGSSRKSRSWIC